MELVPCNRYSPGPFLASLFLVTGPGLLVIFSSENVL